MVKVKRDLKLKTTLGVQTCLLPENCDDIEALAIHVKNIGFDYITFRPISNHPKNTYHVKEDLLVKFKENLQKAEQIIDNKFNVFIRWNLYQEEKTYSQCLGLPFIAFVNADGGVYTCGCHLDESEYCYGNLYEQSFSEIWLSKKRMELTKKASETPDFRQCDIICRHHAINKFLWEYSKEPEHVNFI
ncbi:MAG: SPASM domain-containing protein [Desulfobacterales bacterium]|nr:SPASM domain-containing protein [Desulfobacterales bacterium]